jgi:hypothetical protein
MSRTTEDAAAHFQVAFKYLKQLQATMKKPGDPQLMYFFGVVMGMETLAAAIGELDDKLQDIASRLPKRP